MLHVYKLGGPWKKGEVDYTIKCINVDELSFYLSQGWVQSFEELTSFSKEELIKQLEERDIKHDGRWGIEKLQEALENG